MTETAAEPTPTKRRIGARSIAAVLALILGLGLLPLGTVTYWGHRTVTDTERYLETMEPLAYDESVQDSLSVFITDKIEEQIDPEALVNQIFAGLIEQYPSLKALVPIIAGAVDSLIAQVVDRLVRSDQFRQLWDLANTAAQKSLMAILEGRDDGPVSLQGDEVVLDIGVLVDQVKQGLVDRGFEAAANINVSQADRQIVLLEAPQLAQIRTIYSLTSPIAAGLVFFAVLLLVLAVVLARRRPRMAAWAGGGAAVGGLRVFGVDLVAADQQAQHRADHTDDRGDAEDLAVHHRERQFHVRRRGHRGLRATIARCNCHHFCSSGCRCRPAG